MIEYKGYAGIFEYDPDDEVFHGKVVNLSRDGINFVGRSVKELKHEMAESVDDYLDWCAERGEDPERPFSGNMLLRGTPELHRAATVAAARENKSLNAWIVETLGRAVADRSV